MNRLDRGCVFFNFGNVYALRLLVSLFSMRQIYNGPITVFLAHDAAGAALRAQLERLDCEVAFVDRLSRSHDKHRLFHASPYRTTLLFDSDLIFQTTIDDLWGPLEGNGLLVTRFFPNPHGVDGSAACPGWANRLGLLEQVRELVDAETYATAARRLLKARIDVNVGVMGLSKPAGNPFLAAWTKLMEGKGVDRIRLLDEMLVIALLPRHGHFLADESWNCPADELFRRTNLADARIIHYFADGQRVRGLRLGRSRATWAGQKWYEAYRQAGRDLDLRRWTRLDPTFERPPSRLVSASLRAIRSVSRRTAGLYGRLRELSASATR
jgi:hypothetical protein